MLTDCNKRAEKRIIYIPSDKKRPKISYCIFTKGKMFACKILEQITYLFAFWV